MKYLFALAILAAATVPKGNEPEPWHRQTWQGIIEVESNPWGGFGKRTFGLWVDGETGILPDIGRSGVRD